MPDVMNIFYVILLIILQNEYDFYFKDAEIEIQNCYLIGSVHIAAR